MSHLVLTRRESEKVMIGEDIVVTVLEIRSGQVRLGFEAPRDKAVHRFEVWQRIRLGLDNPRRSRAIAAARERREQSA